MNTNAPGGKPAKPAKAIASNPFEGIVPPAASFELPAAFRDMADRSVSQARDAYAKLKSAAEDATNLVEGTMETARQGAFALSAKTLDAARSNSDASFAFARDLLGAKTFSDVIELQSSFARSQFEAFTGQWKELQQLTEKLFTDTTKPVSERVEKTLKELKVA
jgi:phasin